MNTYETDIVIKKRWAILLFNTTI